MLPPVHSNGAAMPPRKSWKLRPPATFAEDRPPKGVRQKGVRLLFVLKKRLVLAPSRSVSLFLSHTLRGNAEF